MPGLPDENPPPNEGEKKSVGVIIPPTDIRKIADKTAEFVAKNGASFEELVIKAESNNAKFSFLKQEDPYRAYYDHKVTEFAKNETKKEPAPITEVKTQPAKPETIPGLNSFQFTIKKELKKDAKPPAPDQFTVFHGSTISSHSSLDIDIIKHTSQFVAKNGQKFLIALTEREKQNPQFDFLKPTHQLFSFFTNLVDAYSKVIAPKKDELFKLQNNINDKTSILNRCGERFEFENMQKIAKKKKEEYDEEERRIFSD